MHSLPRRNAGHLPTSEAGEVCSISGPHPPRPATGQMANARATNFGTALPEGRVLLDGCAIADSYWDKEPFPTS